MRSSKESSPEENSPSYESSPQEGESEAVNSPEKIPEDIEGEDKVSDVMEDRNEMSNPSQSSSQYRGKVKTLCEELQDIKKEIGYEEHRPRERSYKIFPKFEVSIGKKCKRTSREKPIQLITDENRPLLRSIERMGEIIEKEYRFVKRLPIDKEEPDWNLIKTSIEKFEKKELPKKVKKKCCSNCLQLLAQGIPTDKCRKHSNKNNK